MINNDDLIIQILVYLFKLTKAKYFKINLSFFNLTKVVKFRNSTIIHILLIIQKLI